MNKLKVKKILKNAKEIKLPGCTYCRTLSCRECAYLERHSPDSQGKCRCSFHGRWYYLHEGCTSGITWSEKEERDREAAKRKEESRRRSHTQPIHTPPIRDTQPSYSSNRSEPPRRNDRGNDDGGGAAALFFAFLFICGLVSRIESCAADVGLLKSEVTFQLTASSAAEESNVPDGVTLVNSDGERRSYTIEFDETQEIVQKIRKGGYDRYLLEDRMAFSSGGTYFDGIEDYTRTASEMPMEEDLLNTLVLTIRGQSLPAEGLTVTNQAGDILPCTPYGDDGTYIVLLYDRDLSDPCETLTVSAPGYEKEEVRVDFRDKRICEKKIKLSKE